MGMPTTPGPLAGAGPIRQCAYLVRDLDGAVAQWAALGVGPFLAMPRQAMQGYVHRGAPSDPELTLAFANSGDLQIELIVAHDEKPSPFTEALAAGVEGAHHLAWWVEDWDAWAASAAAAGWVPLTHVLGAHRRDRPRFGVPAPAAGRNRRPADRAAGVA